MEGIHFAGSKCLYCSQAIKGRSDKKFCDDQCRASFHNNRKRKHERLITETNSQLRRNRRILKALCPAGKTTVSREVAASMGFDFTIFTSIFSTKAGVYYFSYEYGFCPLIEDHKALKMVIVQKQSHMDKKWDPWRYVK